MKREIPSSHGAATAGSDDGLPELAPASVASAELSQAALHPATFRQATLSQVNLLSQRLRDGLEMTKPRVMLMVAVTAVFGFALAAPWSQDSTQSDWSSVLANLVVGTLLIGGGSIALNQVVEADADRRMHRTRDRPVAAGRVGIWEGRTYAAVLSILGLAVLALGTTTLTAGLAALTWVLYVYVYTPAKRWTPWCTEIGAVPGALPPVLGWTAAGGSLDVMAGVLFALLFCWQLPHALAIAWIHREDYARGGFRMWSGLDDAGRAVRLRIMGYTVALFVVTSVPFLNGIAGAVYLIGCMVAGLGLLLTGWSVARDTDPRPARRLLIVASVYLLTVLSLMVGDRGV